MKNRINIIFISILTFAVMLMSSCEKESNRTSNIHQKYNVETPYSSVGIMHNQLLDSVGLKMADTLAFYAEKGTLSDTDKENIYACFLLKAQEYLTSNLSLDEAGIIITHFERNFTIDSFSVQVENTVYDSILTSVISTIGITIDDFIAAVEAKEIEIMNNPSNINHQDDYTLMMLSVLKYSAFYWYDASLNEENPWHLFINRMNQESKNNTSTEAFTNIIDKIVNWVKKKANAIKEEWGNIALADAAGAASSICIFGFAPQNVAISAALQSGAFVLQL